MIPWMTIPKKARNAKARQTQLDQAKKQFPEGEYRFCPTHGVGPAFPGSKYKCIVCAKDLRYYCSHCRAQYDRHHYDDHAECRFDADANWKTHPDLKGFLASDDDDDASLDDEQCVFFFLHLYQRRELTR
jgi:hypothetical protein